jgi:RecA-family ATPase
VGEYDALARDALDRARRAYGWSESRRGESDGPSKPHLHVSGQDEPPLPITSAGELIRKYPERRPAIIEGLLRVGETTNVIAAPKAGKSWLSLSLAFAVATGRVWLSKFHTTQGNVLIIDNELHTETIAHRLRTLAGAMNMPPEEIARTIDIVALRGRLENLVGLGVGLRQIERGRYALIIVDAW